MSGTKGIGQQDPHDTSSAFNQHRFLIQQMLGRISTMKTVKVIAVYDYNMNPLTETGNTGIAGFVDVQILTNQVDGDGNSIPHGVINGVPYARLQGGKNTVISDPEKGDIGMMVVADRDISSVKANRGQANPGSFRQFDPADGIYFGSIVSEAPDQYVRFRKDGIDLIDKNDNVVTTTPDGIRLTDKMGSIINMAGGDITCTPNQGVMKIIGNMQVTGNLIGGYGTSDAVGLQTHTHTQPNDSHGDTEAATNPPTPGT